MSDDKPTERPTERPTEKPAEKLAEKPAKLGAAGPLNITKAERMRDALTLRKNGMAYPDIARELGVTKQTAVNLVRQGITEIPKEEAEHTRAVMNARFDDMIARSYQELQIYDDEVRLFTESKGQEGRCAKADIYVQIHDAILRVESARAKLFGLNAPVEVKASGTALVGIADLLEIQRTMEANEAPVTTVVRPELDSPELDD